MLNMIRRLMGAEEPVERTPQAQLEADRRAQSLALYHYAGCPFCGKVQRAISRLNIDIAMHDINRDADARQRLIEGGGKKTVPCLHIDAGEKSAWLYESSDIVNYLERNFAATQ